MKHNNFSRKNTLYLTAFLVLFLFFDNTSFAPPPRPKERPKERERIEEKTPTSKEKIEERIKREEEEAARKEELKRRGIPLADPGAAKGGVAVPRKVEPKSDSHDIEVKGDSFPQKKEGVSVEDRFSSRPGALPKIKDFFESLENATREKIREPEQLKRVLEMQKKLWDEVEKDPNAKAGFLALQEAFLNQVTREGKLTDRGARELLKWIVERKGRKEIDKDLIELMETVLCSSKCGVAGMERACRRISRFKKAATIAGIILIPAALTAAFNYFINHEAIENDTVDIPADSSKQLPNLKISGLNEPVPEEQVTPPQGQIE